MVRDLEHGVTPVHLAAAAGHAKVLRFFGNCNGVDMDVKDRHSRTPLHYACQDGKEECVKVLAQELKCDCSVKDENGITPRHLAVFAGNIHLLIHMQEVICTLHHTHNIYYNSS